MGNSDTILKEYDDKLELNSEFTIKIEKLINDLLREKGIRIHTVTSRTKDKESLKYKLTRSVNPYGSLCDIKDI